jgi:zeaxanthin epoxidase
MDETLFARVMALFTFTGTRVCGIKDGLRADGSFSMAGDDLAYLWDEAKPADWFVRFPLKECADLFGLPYTGVIDRPDLQETFLDECKAMAGAGFIQNGKPVTSYANEPDGSVRLGFKDGR